jgi:hypothetical protein
LFLLSLPLIAFPCFSLAQKSFTIPAQYGEVIYRSQEERPSQIFIIGLSHRDSITRANGNHTVRVQAEVYQIADRLIHDQGVQLLLPEGFFENPKTAKGEEKPDFLNKSYSCTGSCDTKALEKRLADDSTFINAEMLLKENHPLSLRMSQIEDEGLYDEVRNDLVKLANGGKDSCDYSLLVPELDYLQERRTAAMLQNIPRVVDAEAGQGHIKKRKAIFTVGLSHIQPIVSYLNEARITVHAPFHASNKNKDYFAELNLSKKNYGVTIIIPRTLADDLKTLEMNRLDKIVRDCRK